MGRNGVLQNEYLKTYCCSAGTKKIRSYCSFVLTDLTFFCEAIFEKEVMKVADKYFMLPLGSFCKKKSKWVDSYSCRITFDVANIEQHCSLCWRLLSSFHGTCGNMARSNQNLVTHAILDVRNLPVCVLLGQPLFVSCNRNIQESRFFIIVICTCHMFRKRCRALGSSNTEEIKKE